MHFVVRRWFAASSFAALLVTTLESIALCAVPLEYNGGYYTQSFDGLSTNVTNAAQTIMFPPQMNGPLADFTGTINAVSGMEGWQLANPFGSSSNTEFKSQDGSLAGSSGRGVISFGTNGSTDRALGTLATSNQISRFGLLLKNNTTSTTYTKFSINFVGEIWRRGNIVFPPAEGGMNNLLIFEYGEGADINTSTTSGAHFPLSFGGPMASGYSAPPPSEVAINGNDSIYRAALSETISGIDWAPGETLVLRWSGLDLTGQDDGLAIDELTFLAIPSGVSQVRGDFNQDHLLSNLDIQALLGALVDLDAYKLAKGIENSDLSIFGDINNSGTVDSGDITPLRRLLTGNLPQITGVPEPSTLTLVALSVLGLLTIRGRNQLRVDR